MPLIDPKVKNAKSGDKAYKLADAHGLYLLVQPSGGKLWRYDYRFNGTRKTLAIGCYPIVGLAAARDELNKARVKLAAGTDPSGAKRALKDAKKARDENGFEAIAREWFAKFSKDWAETHSEKVIRRLERDVFPWIGALPIGSIEPADVLRVLRRIESRGKLETAHRALQNCGQVFRYGVATGRASRDPTADLRGALSPWKPKHYAAIKEPAAVGELLRAIDGFSGTFPTACALKLAPMLFVRPGELRQAEWSEIDFEKAEWRIPAAKMKARVIHIVPLAEQALSIIRELQPLTGHGRYLFPSTRTGRKPMSENTLNAALRRLGYSKEQMTAHGFRAMASTLLNERGYNRDWIERQLAHGERDQVRAAYNYAEHLPERRKMMREWSDYLDGLKRGAQVIPFRRAS